jgi:hypothetical protein
MFFLMLRFPSNDEKYCLSVSRRFLQIDIDIANKLYRTPIQRLLMHPTARSGNDLMSALALHNTLTCISPSRLADEDNDKHADRSRISGQ